MNQLYSILLTYLILVVCTFHIDSVASTMLVHRHLSLRETCVSSLGCQVCLELWPGSSLQVRSTITLSYSFVNCFSCLAVLWILLVAHVSTLMQTYQTQIHRRRSQFTAEEHYVVWQFSDFDFKVDMAPIASALDSSSIALKFVALARHQVHLDLKQ